MAGLDFALLRTSKGDRIASHLKSKQSELGTSATTLQLFEGITSESIPSTVLNVWIDVSKDDTVLKECLVQDQSRLLRRAAIRRFIRRLNSNKFEATWDLVGGTQGVIKFLSQCAVHEVKLFCQVFAGLAKTKKYHKEISRNATTLLHSLCSREIPGAEFQNVDSRPLLKQYSQLLPACEPDFVRSWLANSALPYSKTEELINAHPEICRNVMVDALEKEKNDHSKKLAEDMLKTLPQTCPPDVEKTAELSPSMSLSLQLLENLKQPHAKNRSQLTTLTTILMRRLARYRKRAANGQLAGTWSALIKIVDAKHTGDKDTLRAVSSFLQSWSPQSQEFAPLLVPLLQSREYTTFEQICYWMRRVDEKNRTELVRIALKTSKTLKIDMDSSKDLKSNGSSFPVDLFLLLPPEEALELLNLIEKAKPELNQIGTLYSHYGRRTDRLVWGRLIATDPAIMRIILSRNMKDAERNASTMIADAKLQAEMERDRNQRPDKVVQVIKLSMATGSLATLHSSLAWTKRFIKDQGTLSRLCSGSLIDDDNATLPKLLAGFGYYPYANLPSLEQLRDQVITGNFIIELLFQMAVVSITEPGFQQYIWQHVFCLMKFVVRWRSEKMTWLQEVVGLSADEIYKSVWEPTIESCMRIEAISSDESNAVLFDSFYTMYEGPMFAGYARALDLEGKTLHPATLRFIDTLAQQRDQFWAKKRAAEHSDIVLLSNIWPRGLPVECLVPIEKLENYAWQGLPYIEQRAKEVVFFDGKAAAEEVDDDLKDAISAFVNNYEFSVKFWVQSKKEEPDQEERMLEAWNHAVANSPPDRFTADEVQYFWAKKFDDIFKSLPKQLVAIRDGSVVDPSYDEPEMAIEWNPQPGLTKPSSSSEEEVKYPIIALDAMFSTSSRMAEGKPEPFDFQRDIKPAKVPLYFNTGSHWKELRDNGEKYILASLLTLETRHGASGKLLDAPFPDARDIRFPASFLDQEFIEAVGDDDYRQLWTLDAYGTKVPTKLTRRLLEILAEERAEKGTHDPAPYMKAMRALLSNDRPTVFLDLVQQLIVDDVEASSWHRHFLHSGLLRRLSKDEAASFLDRVVGSIIAKLEQTKHENEARLEQEDDEDEEMEDVAESGITSVESDEEDKTKEKKSTVKLSTIKLLAQLLTNADFVSQDQSLNILTNLFAASGHVDVRIAILQSLFDILKSTSDSKIERQILALFKEVIPIAASINEHKVMTEERWQYFDGAGKVPMVFRDSDGAGPTLHFLLELSNRLGSSSDSRDLRLRDFMINEILLPIVHQSVQSNERWTRSFLKAHSFSEELAATLPTVPVHPTVLVKLVQMHVNVLPSWILEMHTAYVRANLDRASGWAKINKTILENRDISKSQAGINWIEVYAQRPENILELPTNDYYLQHGELKTPGLHGLLDKSVVTEVKDGIQLEDLQEFWWFQARYLIHAGSEQSKGMTAFLDKLEIHHTAHEMIMAPWQKQARPLLEKIIRYVEHLRTPEWQHDANRKPDVLPDMTKYRLSLLTWPTRLDDQPEQEKVAAFVDGFIAAVENLSEQSPFYHERLPILRTAVQKLAPEHAIMVAVKLATVGQWQQGQPTLFQWLCLSLAGDLIASIKRRSGDLDQRLVQQLVYQLTTLSSSPIEDLRTQAKRMLTDANTLLTHARSPEGNASW